MTAIAREKALSLLRGFRGKLFAATFIKKNGEIRNMVARMGVRRAKGTGTYSHTRDLTRSNVTVWDVQKGEYRAIPLDRVISIRNAGAEFTIKS